MASISRVVGVLVLCAVAVSVLLASPADAQLKPDFYAKSCPNLLAIVTKRVQDAVQKEARMAASLLRLHFHDCFVQGCDGSILLDDDSRLPQGEKGAAPNANSVRGYEVIDLIKSDLEKQCPKVVSCADIATLAAYVGIKLAGGPAPAVPLGRRDALSGSLSLANSNLPGPSSTVAQLKAKFTPQGLNTQDLVALSGAHTLGFSRCALITSRLYNFNGGGGADPTIDPTFLASLKKTCPQNGDGNVLKNFDTTPAKFDNAYYREVVAFQGVLNSDEVLFTQSSDTKALVQAYAKDQNRFFTDFATSLLKMSAISPPSGSKSEIRLNCRKPNSLSLEDMDEVIQLVSDM
ncbi:hypothetical protein R1flu_004487 [Riccia fluitans]|uniref:Peroxidase n=1 Tax=Riccia fluitans TaxID=41844 RepID=A0ABD1YR13_9MARC